MWNRCQILILNVVSSCETRSKKNTHPPAPPPVNFPLLFSPLSSSDHCQHNTTQYNTTRGNTTLTLLFITVNQHHVQLTTGHPKAVCWVPLCFFFIIINDISHIFKNFKLILFADDSTLYITGKDQTDKVHKANTDLDIFYKWCISNRLTVNLNKTFYMLFTNKEINILRPLFYQDSITRKTSKHTVLGITYDHALGARGVLEYSPRHVGCVS